MREPEWTGSLVESLGDGHARSSHAHLSAQQNRGGVVERSGTGRRRSKGDGQLTMQIGVTPTRSRAAIRYRQTNASVSLALPSASTGAARPPSQPPGPTRPPDHPYGLLTPGAIVELPLAHGSGGLCGLSYWLCSQSKRRM